MCVALILSSCAHQSSTPEILDRNAYQQKLSQLTHWNLSGKIAIRQKKFAADFSDFIVSNHSASFEWMQQGEHFNIFISGPLNVGATYINGSINNDSIEQITVKNNQGETSTTHDPEQLLIQQLGWSLPLHELSQWVLGAGPQADIKTQTTTNNRPTYLDAAQFNDDNTLAHFAQQDWLIEYDRYQVVGEFLLPEKIRLNYQSSTRHMKITLIIKRWELN